MRLLTHTFRHTLKAGLMGAALAAALLFVPAAWAQEQPQQSSATPSASGEEGIAKAALAPGFLEGRGTGIGEAMNFDKCLQFKVKLCWGLCPGPMGIPIPVPGIEPRYQEPTAIVETVCNPGKSHYSDQQNLASRFLSGTIASGDMDMKDQKKCLESLNTGTGYYPRFYYETHVWGITPLARYNSSGSGADVTLSLTCWLAGWISKAVTVANLAGNFEISDMKLDDFSLDSIGESLEQGVSDFGETLSNLPQNISDSVSSAISDASDAVTKLGDTITDLPSKIEGFAGSIEGGISGFGDSLDSLGSLASSGDLTALNSLGDIAKTVGEVGQYVSIAGALTGNESLAKAGAMMGAAGALGALSDIDFEALQELDMEKIGKAIEEGDLKDIAKVMELGSKVTAPFALIDPRFAQISQGLGMGAFGAGFAAGVTAEDVTTQSENVIARNDALHYGNTEPVKGSDLGLTGGAGMGYNIGHGVGDFLNNSDDYFAQAQDRADKIGESISNKFDSIFGGTAYTEGEHNTNKLYTQTGKNLPSSPAPVTVVDGLPWLEANPALDGASKGAPWAQSAANWPDGTTLRTGLSEVAGSQQFKTAAFTAEETAAAGVYSKALASSITAGGVKDPQFLCSSQRSLSLGKSKIGSISQTVTGTSFIDNIFPKGSYLPDDVAVSQVAQNCPLTQAGYVFKNGQKEHVNCEEVCVYNDQGQSDCRLRPKNDMFGSCDRALSTFKIDNKYPACDGTVMNPVYQTRYNRDEEVREVVGYQKSYDASLDHNTQLNNKYADLISSRVGQSNADVTVANHEVDGYIESLQAEAGCSDGSCGCKDGVPYGDWGVAGEMGDFASRITDETGLGVGTYAGLLVGGSPTAEFFAGAGTFEGEMGADGFDAALRGTDAGNQALGKLDSLVGSLETIDSLMRSGGLKAGAIGYVSSYVPWGLYAAYLSEWDSPSWRQGSGGIMSGIRQMIGAVGHPICALGAYAAEIADISFIQTTAQDFLGCVGTWGTLEPKTGFVYNKDRAVAAAMAGYRGHNIAVSLRSIKPNTKDIQQFNLDFPHRTGCYNIGTPDPTWTSELSLNPVSSITGAVGIAKQGAEATTVKDEGYVFTYWKKTACCILPCLKVKQLY